MGLIEVLGIIIIHWFADFVIQTDSQAKGKSKNWSDLLEHTWNYSLIWVAVGAFYVCPGWNWNDGNPTSLFFYWTWMGIFPLITFIFHTATDYFTSRLNSRLWGKEESMTFSLA
jgi:hypothetical protein